MYPDAPRLREADRQAITADTAMNVGRNLKRSITRTVEEADRILADAGARPLSDTEYRRFRSIVSRAGEDAQLLQSIRAIEAEQRSVAVAVRSEPRAYGPGSGHSYFRDLFLKTVPGIEGHAEAVERLHCHQREVTWEAKRGSDEGSRALRAARTSARDRGRQAIDGETRALTTATGSFGAFVTPQYLTTELALYRVFGPAFTKQTNQVDDSGYGLQINVPRLTSGTTVGEQTEGNPVSDSSPTTSYASAPLVVRAGEVEITQQLLDRSGPGISADQVLHCQLMQALWADLDGYVIA